MSRPLGALHKDLVGEHVQLLLRFALHIDAIATFVASVVAHHPRQLTKSHRTGNAFAGQGNVQNQGVEVAARAGEAAAFFNQELGQGAVVGLVA